MDVLDAPKITFDGKWLPWHVDFYDSVPYWEAWFFSSGTLTVEGSYTADAWGIGGGAGGRWGTSSHSSATGSAGTPNTQLGILLSGSVAVTIGAGGNSRGSNPPNAGGDTKLSDVLTCEGGRDSSTAYPRYRFGSADKAGEAGGSSRSDGWLPLTVNKSLTSDTATEGAGIGAGAGAFGLAHSGALVIRIPM